MKILHTSDWHLGKYLEKYSRLSEQKQFIDELERICETENVDLIIIAGDVYDTVNPPIEAEKLFFSALKRLSLLGRRPIVVIAGNHDSGDRIISSYPLAIELGIILINSPKSIVTIGKYDFFNITSSGEGFFEIELNNEKAVFLNIPYPTEKNLNEIIFNGEEDLDYQISYSNKIKSILDQLQVNFKEDTINIVTGHFFVTGGKESDSERKIQAIGGIYSVSSNIFPEKSQYIALGHLHRPQKISNNKYPIYYSGSPIQYSVSEINYKKVVNIINLKPNEKAIIKKVNLTNYKPIEVWKCENYEEAFIKCKENSNKNCWVYLQIKSDYPLTPMEIKKLRDEKSDIVNISVIFNNQEFLINEKYEEISIEQQFKNFYIEKQGVSPKDEILNLFLEIVSELEE